MRLEDTHTPAGYFIAIVAVLGGALLMPPFPMFIIGIAPALLLGILAYSLLRARRRKIQTASMSPVVHTAPVYPAVSAALSVPAPIEEGTISQQAELEAVSA